MMLRLESARANARTILERYFSKEQTEQILSSASVSALEHISSESITKELLERLKQGNDQVFTKLYFREYAPETQSPPEKYPEAFYDEQIWKYRIKKIGRINPIRI